MSVTLCHRVLVVLLAAAPLSGCMVMKKIFTPEQARLEEYEAKNKAEVAEHPDGECATAEGCMYRCEVLGRALDCYKTGKAALGGVDVAYEGGYRVSNAAGSTDDIDVTYEEASEEHVSLMPLARDAFDRACTANHAESCRLSGDLIVEHDPAAGATYYRKACDLQDEAACAKITGTN
jgi:hypothetical protein